MNLAGAFSMEGFAEQVVLALWALVVLVAVVEVRKLRTDLLGKRELSPDQSEHGAINRLRRAVVGDDERFNGRGAATELLERIERLERTIQSHMQQGGPNDVQ